MALSADHIRISSSCGHPKKHLRKSIVNKGRLVANIASANFSKISVTFLFGMALLNRVNINSDKNMIMTQNTAFASLSNFACSFVDNGQKSNSSQSFL